MAILFSFFLFNFRKKRKLDFINFFFRFFPFLFHSVPNIPTPIHRVPTLIPHIPTPILRIPTLISRIPTPIPRIPRIHLISTPILHILNLIPRIPTLIPCIPNLIPRVPIIPLIPFPDSLFRLLQIAITISVLLTFREILLALSHWTKWERSWLIFSFISFEKELTYRTLVSSAKWCTDENIITLLSSLIYIRNSRDHNIEPMLCCVKYTRSKSGDKIKFFRWPSDIDYSQKEGRKSENRWRNV